MYQIISIQTMAKQLLGNKELKHFFQNHDLNLNVIKIVVFPVSFPSKQPAFNHICHLSQSKVGLKLSIVHIILSTLNTIFKINSDPKGAEKQLALGQCPGASFVTL